MTGPNVLKRILDTGGTYADMSQKNAEKLVAEFVKAGQVRRKDAEKMVQRLVERGRERTEYLINVIRAEVTKQLGVFAGQLDDIEARVEEMAANLGLGSRMPAKRSTTTTTTTTTTPAARQAAGPSGVAKVTTRKAPTRKKAAVKKKAAPAKKKSAAKKATVKKSSTQKKSSAKKASVKKAPAKQSF